MRSLSHLADHRVGQECFTHRRRPGYDDQLPWLKAFDSLIKRRDPAVERRFIVEGFMNLQILH